MLDRFEVWRDAESLRQAWGEVDYAFPHKKDSQFKPGAKVGVLLPQLDPTGVVRGFRYGWMTWGYREQLQDRSGMSFISEDLFLAGGRFERVLQARRCLIPVDRWYFHKKTGMQKHWFSFRPVDRSAMAFAGVYATFSSGNGTKENYVGIVGLSSGEYYRDFDERMPALFLPEPEAVDYLTPKLPHAKVWERLRAFPEDRMMVEPCSEWATAGE